MEIANFINFAAKVRALREAKPKETMADNFLENHYAEYEQRKKRWQQKQKSHLPKRLKDGK